MTTERIDIQVDDSQLNDLISSLQSLVRKLDDVGDEAKGTAKDLDKLDKEAKDSERSLDKLTKAARGLGSGLNIAANSVTGLSSVLEIGKKAFELFKAAAEAAYAAVEVAAETNEDAARSLEEFNDAVTEIRTTIGLAVIQTTAWKDVQAILNSLISESDTLTTSFKASVDVLWDSIKDVVTSLLELASTILPTFNTNMTLANGQVVDMKDTLEGGFDNSPMKTALLQIATLAFQLAQGIDDASTSLQTLWQTAKAVQLGLSTIGQFISTGSVSQQTLQQIYDLEDDVDRIITDAVNREDTRRNTLALLTAELTGDGGGGPRTRLGSGGDGVPDALRRPAEEGIPDALRRRDGGGTTGSRSSSSSSEENWEFEAWNVTESLAESSAEIRRRTELLQETRSIVGDILSDSAETRAEAERELQIERQQTAELERQAQLILEAQQARLESFQIAGINAGTAFGQDAIRAMMEGSDTLGLDIGESFSSTGLGFLSQQLPSLLGATGPWGAALSGGISLIGSIVSGLFGRERRRREREARAAAPQNFNTSSNYITTNNVGLIIGDRRAVTQQLSNFNTDTQRRAG